MRLAWPLIAICVVLLLSAFQTGSIITTFTGVGPPPGYFSTLPPHATLPTAAACAAQIPVTSELHPENTVANNTVPTAAQLAVFQAQPMNFVGAPPNSDFANVNGNYTGSTDMVIRWASCKWGLDENTFRAEAWDESVWSAYTTGDIQTTQTPCIAGFWDGFDPIQSYCWQSYGLLQTKFFSFNLSPQAWDSTPFDADFRGAFWRACMNGDATYLNGPAHTAGFPPYPTGGTSDQLFQGCLGAWFSGDWYSSAAITYINTVNGFVASAPWLGDKANAALAITSPANNAAVSGSVPITITLNQVDPNACFACLSIDGVRQTCTPATGPWTWNTAVHVLYGHHAIQADSFVCAGGNPKYHAAVNVTVIPTNAVDPRSAPYNAVCDGVTNDFNAFSTALATKNLYLPSTAHNTCLINPPSNGGILVQAKTIQCAPGVVLKTTFQDTSNTAIFRFEGNGAGGNSNINHCTLQGPNNITTPTFISAQQANFLVEDWCTAAQGGPCHLVLDSNTFQGCPANACVTAFGNDLTGPVVGGQASNNTFKGCGIYGIALVSATNWMVGGNVFTDCANGSEPDDTGQANNHNTISNNLMTCVNDIGWKPAIGGKHMFLTGGEAGPFAFDYSTNIVSNNVLNGACVRIDEGGGTVGVTPAQYINNTCNGNNPPLAACITHF